MGANVASIMDKIVILTPTIALTTCTISAQHLYLVHSIDNNIQKVRLKRKAEMNNEDFLIYI